MNLFSSFKQKNKDLINIHKDANGVICIFELYLKTKIIRLFFLVSILLFYDEQDLVYEQFTA